MATAAGAAVVLEPLVSLAVGVLFVAVARLGPPRVGGVGRRRRRPARRGRRRRPPAVEVLLWAGVAVLVVARHRSNLARLVAGTEPALPDRDA